MTWAHAVLESKMVWSTYELGLQGVAVAVHTASGRARQRQMMRLASIEQLPSQATPWSAAHAGEKEADRGKHVIEGVGRHG